MKGKKREYMSAVVCKTILKTSGCGNKKWQILYVAENEIELRIIVAVVVDDVPFFFSVETADKRQILYKRAKMPKQFWHNVLMQLMR